MSARQSNLKGSADIKIVFGQKQVHVDLLIESVEDAGAAVEALKQACRAVWNGLVFEGEPGFDDMPDGEAA